MVRALHAWVDTSLHAKTSNSRLCVLTQPMLNGVMLSVDDSHIAWPSDINHKFANEATTNFNTVPAFRGGGTLNGTLKAD